MIQDDELKQIKVTKYETREGFGKKIFKRLKH